MLEDKWNNCESKNIISWQRSWKVQLDFQPVSFNNFPFIQDIVSKILKILLFLWNIYSLTFVSNHGTDWFALNK